jgi:hypothetical protein
MIFALRSILNNPKPPAKSGTGSEGALNRASSKSPLGDLGVIKAKRRLNVSCSYTIYYKLISFYLRHPT